MRSSLILGLMLLTGCGTVQTEYIRELPPASLLEDCQVPQIVLRTNQDLATHIVDLRGALRACNQDKAALREWAKE